MLKKQSLYWILQFGGWSLLFSLSLINRTISIDALLKMASLVSLGVLLSHCTRFVIIRFDAISKSFWKQSSIVILNSIVSSIVFSFIRHVLYVYVYNSENNIFDFINVLNIAAYFLIWQIIYFIYVLREKSRLEMLNNLHLEALNHEIELKNLRSQLNPHFIFNALNSVRALVDEDKANAKNAITLISNVMRTILVSEKQKTIPLYEELKLVNDYLQLEKIRFEDRLNLKIEIPSDLNSILVPPLSVQTLVENAIKHGVSNRISPSLIEIIAKKEEKHLIIKIANDIAEKSSSKSDSTHTGLNNLKKRLDILYDSKAKFKFEITNKATATIHIPL